MAEQSTLDLLNNILNEGRKHKIDLSDPEPFYERFENTLVYLEINNIKYKQIIEKLERNKVSDNNYYLILDEIKEQDVTFIQILIKLLEIHKVCADLEGKDDVLKEQESWLKHIEPLSKL
jgi:hypothetical protein